MNRVSPPPNVHPTVIKHQYDRHNVWAFENHWHTDLFSCRPPGRYCFACFCSCCMGCKLAKYLGERMIIGCFPCALSYLRTKLRTARRIEGTCCGDYCAAACCMPCTATQMANELEFQGIWETPKGKSVKQLQNDHFTQSNGFDFQ